MKHICKRSRPWSLYRWQLSSAKLPGAQYGAYGFPTADVQRALLEEQGAICAYTMIRIGADTSHIEHLKPRTASKAEGRLEETYDYSNMVACYPRSRGPGDPPVTFGAIYRGSSWDAKYFITPLTPACESRLRFQPDGHVQPARSNDMAAGWTIDALKLDDSKLVDLRVAAIDAWGFSLVSDAPLKRGEAARALASVERRARDGMFEPFCVALRHAAQEYVALLDKAVTRKKYARTKKGGKRRP